MKLDQLFEATLNINTIIDYIYKEAFKTFIDEIDNYRKGRRLNMNRIKLKTTEFTPKLILQKMHSPNIKNAMTDLPVTIKAGVFPRGSYYSTVEKTIYISFHQGVYDVLQQHAGVNKYRELSVDIPPQLRKNFEQELNGSKVKASIAHEISHWMRDAKHGKQITKMVDKAQESPSRASKTFTRGQSDIYLTDYEMDALVHGIKQIKRDYDQAEWDSFTLSDLFDKDPASMTNMNNFNKQQQKQYKKLLLKRLHRERLLGKKMR